MKLLVLTAQYPFPPRVGSAVVAYNQLKELSKRHSIYLISSVTSTEKLDSPEFVEQVEVFQRKQRTKIERWLRILLGSAPFVAASRSDEMRARVREVIEHNKFDAILVYELHAIEYCPQASFNMTIANIEDPPWITLDRWSRLSVWSPWQKFKWSIYARLTKRYEAYVLPKLARALLLSEADVQDMRDQQVYDNLGHVPYGVAQRPSADIVGLEGRTEGMIVFSGNMFHPPNVDGILYFLTEILQLVLRESPLATLWIVGAEPDPQIRAAAARFGDRVVITGRVDDMSEYLRRAKVSICPVRLKIGVQTKVLEALSWATPVVTTSAGNSGIGACSGRELWVEDEPATFAGHVAALLRGEDWARVSEAGHKFVVERFSWKRSAAELERQIELVRGAP